MTTKTILMAMITSTLLSAMDYGAMAGAIKTPEAIQAASKGTDVTMDDVTKSVDTAKMTQAVMGSSATTSAASTATTASNAIENVQKAQKAKETVDKVQTGMAAGKALKLF
jgi:hypothetical protein